MKTIIGIFILIIVIPISAAANEPVDTIQMIKIAGQDERAIIKTPDGKVQIIKPGDMIGDDCKVVEVTAGRVVFEKKTGSGTETVIVRLEDGKQRVERVKKAGEKQPQLYAVKAPQEQKGEMKEHQKDKKKKGKKDKSK